ncbi:hypothetical protein RvY_10807 [Ramazzottius varieornatus]|uniref:Uncharacterized protein n=1 Tax=Ramazzottius varieornatus TaxID=947166 RepID=A0A1D1VMZ1_RAMVA|nr:hypothetical protein RvY_10807 [Ramazzottius varieornatus]
MFASELRTRFLAESATQNISPTMAYWSLCFVLSLIVVLFALQSTPVRALTSEEISRLENILSLEDLDSHLSNFRLKRSIEGATVGPCSKVGGIPSIYPPFDPVTAGTDSCTANGLPNTRCNEATGYCECDPFISTRFRLTPEVMVCIPLAYVNVSQGRCLPTIPDMCSVLVSGSVCQNALPPPQPGVTTRLPGFRCVCQTGNGTWPNCTPRLGSPCQNTTVCQYRLPNSFCANIDPTTNFGTCQCPRANQPLVPAGYPDQLPAYTQNTFANAQSTACVPSTCPPSTQPPPGLRNLDPCNNDNLSPGTPTTTCTSTSSGYQCIFNPGTKGRAHNRTVTGRCCGSTHLPCSDYSACFDPATDICANGPQCNNCYDESTVFGCTTPWPTQCGPVTAGRSAPGPTGSTPQFSSEKLALSPMI